MNKTPEQIAEEMYPTPILVQDYNKFSREAFIEGYHSRDSEIEKLVEVLRASERYLESAFENEDHSQIRDAIEKDLSELKEALKPYEKP